MSGQDLDQMRERFVQLRQQGYSPDEAIGIVKSVPARAKAHAAPLVPEGIDRPPSVSLATSVGRGAAQGATALFGDEINGLVQAVGNRVLPVSLGGRDPAEAQPSLTEDYRRERDAERAQNDEARRSHPVGYTGAEIGSTLATAPVLPVGKGLAGTMKAGALIGAVMGAGGSRADTTTMQPSEYLRAGGDTALGALIGLGAGAIGHGIIKGVGAAARGATNLARITTPMGNAAKDIASNVAESASTPSGLQGEGTVANAFERSRQLVANWSQMLKEPFVLPASKMTGDRAAALTEQRLQQFGPTMNAAQATRAKMVEQTGKILDMHMENIAADPAKLGRGEVADQLGETLKRHIKGIYEGRVETSSPLYQAYADAGGTISEGEVQPVVATLRQEIGKRDLVGNKLTSQLKGILVKIQGRAGNMSRSTMAAPTMYNLGRTVEIAAPDSTLRVSALNELRQLASETMRRENSMLDGVDAGVQANIAKRVLNAIDQTFDRAAENNASPGIDLLRRANAAWAAGSRAIEDANTETVQTLLAKAGTDAGETIPRQLLSLQPRQVGGVFRILNAQADKSIAQNVRAQMFHEALSAAGAPQPGSIAAANGMNRFSPAQAMTQFYKAEPAFRAAFAGDNKALHALADTFQLLKRVNFGPGLTGSPTYAYAAEDAMQGLAQRGAEAAATAVGGRAAGGATRAILDRLGAIFASPKAAANAVSTPEGIAAINKALRVALQSQSGKVIPAAVAQDASRALAQVVTDLTGGAGYEQQPEEPQIEQPRAIAQRQQEIQ